MKNRIGTAQAYGRVHVQHDWPLAVVGAERVVVDGPVLDERRRGAPAPETWAELGYNSGD